MIGATIPNFKNVVVVRFSVRSKSFERKFLSTERVRERWFKFRAELFEASLGASLTAQTVKPVVTYLYFDAQDIGLVEKYFPKPQFTPVFSDAGHDELMGKRLLEMGGSEHVVLSRIDSDDIVEKRYFEKINALLARHQDHMALGPEAMVVNKSGHRTNFVKMQRVFHISPPFISQYFRNYSGQGAYFNHTELSSQPMPQIEDGSAEWLQVIHGTNVANKFKPPSTSNWKESYMGATESQFGLVENFDPDWFREWAGIPPIPPEWFSSDRLPLGGVGARVRFATRRLLGRA